MTPRWGDHYWQGPDEDVDPEEEGISEDTEDPGDDVGVV